MITLNELGKNYRLDSTDLHKYFGIKEKQNEKQEDTIELNYFAIVTLLYYIKNIERYKSIKSELLKYITVKFEYCSANNRRKNTELTLLLLDLMSCPYIDIEAKKKFLDLNGIKDCKNKILDFTATQKYWFVKWDNFNLAEEIARKSNHGGYS